MPTEFPRRTTPLMGSGKGSENRATEFSAMEIGPDAIEIGADSNVAIAAKTLFNTPILLAFLRALGL